MGLHSPPARRHSQELLIVKPVAYLTQKLQFIQSLIHVGMLMKSLMLEGEQSVDHTNPVGMDHQVVHSHLEGSDH